MSPTGGRVATARAAGSLGWHEVLSYVDLWTLPHYFSEHNPAGCAADPQDFRERSTVDLWWPGER
jgi:hypothetical protein